MMSFGGKSVESQHDAGFWRQRAEDARAVAQTMKSCSERRKMEAIAAAYDRLAEHAERTARRKGAGHGP